MNAHQLDLVDLDCDLNDDGGVVLASYSRVRFVKSDEASLLGPNFYRMASFSKPGGRLDCSFACHRRLFFIEIARFLVNLDRSVELFHHFPGLLAPSYLFGMIALPFGSLSILFLPV